MSILRLICAFLDFRRMKTDPVIEKSRRQALKKLAIGFFAFAKTVYGYFDLCACFVSPGDKFGFCGSYSLSFPQTLAFAVFSYGYEAWPLSPVLPVAWP